MKRTTKITIILSALLVSIFLSGCGTLTGNANPSLAEKARIAGANREAILIEVQEAAKELGYKLVPIEAGSKVDETETPRTDAPAQPPSYIVVVPGNGSQPQPELPNNVIVAQPTVDGPWDCVNGEVDNRCLASMNGWLKGRGALAVKYFETGTKFGDLIQPGNVVSFHFQYSTSQLVPVGINNIPAFGSVATIENNASVLNFFAQSNGHLTIWQDATSRKNACIEWNKLMFIAHPDWTVHSELCQ